MTWVVVAVAAVSTVYTAQQQRDAAKQEEYNLQRQAEQESLAAENEEIIRRERLNKVLAANVASAAAGNIEGSGQAISLQSARKASSSEGAESLSDRLRQDLLRREGKAAAAAGKRQATSTLLTGGARVAQLVPK